MSKMWTNCKGGKSIMARDAVKINKMYGDKGSKIQAILRQIVSIGTESSPVEIRNTLNDAIQLMGWLERRLRQSTVSLRLDISPFLTRSKIEYHINRWLADNKLPSAAVWQDAVWCNVQFASLDIKSLFINVISREIPSIFQYPRLLFESIPKTSVQNEYFHRKLVRLQINRVPCSIKLEDLKKRLAAQLGSSLILKDFKESNRQSSGSRTVFFRACQNGFMMLFRELGGYILCAVENDGTIQDFKLYIKINAKPFQCNKCFVIGSHNCEGLYCAKCGYRGHSSSNCESDVRYCINCASDGHHAKELYCTFFLNEVVRELRLMDIPLVYFEDEQLRLDMIDRIQLR